MKIFSKEQIYQGDALTIERKQISSTDLMEQVGVELFNWLHIRMQGEQLPIHVFCGIGNNGGDGLVLARHLINHGYNVHTYIVNYSKKRSEDFLINYDRIKQATKSWPLILNESADFPEIHPEDIVIDAIFGIGLNRTIDEWVKQLFMHFRASGAFTLAVDVPSGLFVDKAVTDEDAVVWAGYTLSFVAPKLVFFLPETAKYTQQWEALNIGLDETFLRDTKTDVELIGKHEILRHYLPREKFAHKGHFGHSLLIGGSYGKIGAVTLASRGALSVGAGVVSVYVPKCGYNILQSSFPEAMVITDINKKKITAIRLDIKPTVIGFGMGAGTHTQTINAFKAFLKKNKTPLVIDADGVNMLSKKRALLEALPKNTILTPHNKELERLIGTWSDDFDKLEKVKAFSKAYKLILVIKGANTITVFKDKLYINSTGNPGMATAGSGDALTGIITGLVSQGYNPLIAAYFGVYLHGKSADIAVEDFGYQSLIASHIIQYLGKAYLDLFEEPEVPPVEPEQVQPEQVEQDI